MTPLTLFAIAVMSVALILFAIAAVLISANAAAAFRGWLELRERERLSSMDKAKLEARFEEQEKLNQKVSQFMANARQR